MSGYRQSSFDPSAGFDEGRPLRPFNQLQWAGVAVIVVGIAAILATIAGRFGLDVGDTTDWLPMGTTFCALGTVLINTRRAPLSPATKRRRMLIVLAAAALCALTAVLIYYFQGA